MTFEIAEKLIREASAFDQSHYHFVWLGGEPLLAGIDFFKFILDCQNHYLKNKRFRNNIQTNALALNDEWIEFFANSPFRIGISIDGPKEIQDYYRVDPVGTGSFDRVYSNIKKCQEAGLKVGAIATITDFSVKEPEKLFDFFVGNNIKGFGLNFAYETEDGAALPFSVTNEEYSEFMVRMFDLWHQADRSDIRIREIDNIITGMLGGRPKSCNFNGSCSNFFSVGLNGDILPCERFPTQPSFGNILTSTISDCLESSEYRFHAEKVDQLASSCTKCEWQNVCNGGCGHHRKNGRFIFCSGRKKVFRHIQEKLG